MFKLQAQIDDRPDVPRGLYAGLSTGQIYFVDSSDRRLYDNAWLVGLKVGYDIFKYLSAEAQFKFSGHNTSPAGQVNQGIPSSFFAYQSLLAVKGGYPVLRRLTVFAEFGGGLWYTSPNQKANVGSQSRGMATAGLGLQYFTKMKGIALGIDPSIGLIQDLSGPVAQMTGYLRYTF